MKYNGVDTPSNGMLAVSTEGIVLIDTAWTKEQTRALLALAKESFGKECVLAVITHAHEDRIGGIDVLLEKGIKTISTGLTVKMAEKQGYKTPEPDIPMEGPYLLYYSGLKAEIAYYGEGHTCDNIIVWFPVEKVLFGGCLVKGKGADNLGNISDANLEQWPLTLQAVLQKYKTAELVIPGHGQWGGTELIDNTLALLRAAGGEK